MYKINKERFDIYAFGGRMGEAMSIGEEIEYYADNNDNAIGCIGIDVQDKDCFWIILARDEYNVFRAIKQNTSVKSINKARSELEEAFNDINQIIHPQGEGRQGVNLFDTSKNKKQLSEAFIKINTEEVMMPVKKIFEEQGYWLHSQDPNFVQQFQSDGFDQRMWELYLNFVFKSLGLNVNNKELLDFHCYNRFEEIDLCVEATTAGLTTEGVLSHCINDKNTYIQEYMPMKFAGTLMQKLNKKTGGLHYWEKDYSKSKPFAFAIADYNMFDSRSPVPDELRGLPTYMSLVNYLFGIRQEVKRENGKLIVKDHEIENHTYKTKTIPSGYFKQESSENISAVFFSNVGTIAKFQRMGAIAGFAPSHIRYNRNGYIYDQDPNASEPFEISIDVQSDGYIENWHDDVIVIHNPHAKYPIPMDWFLDIMHVYYEDGKVSTRFFNNEKMYWLNSLTESYSIS